jgi:Mitochondrial carrier protein
MPEGETDLTTPLRLTAGAMAGITSVVMTYPLDITRTRLSVQSSSLPTIRKVISTTPTPTTTKGKPKLPGIPPPPIASSRELTLERDVPDHGPYIPHGGRNPRFIPRLGPYCPWCSAVRGPQLCSVRTCPETRYARGNDESDGVGEVDGRGD